MAQFMELAPVRPTPQNPRTALLLSMLTVLSGCSVYDVKQLIVPSNAALLIRQDAKHNALSVPVAGEKFTHLNGVRVDPGQVPVTPSHSLAVETPLIGDSPQPAPLTSPVASLEQAQKTLIRYLAMVEERPERVEKLLAEAEQLAQRYPDDDLLQSLFQRILRYSDWQPVSTIISNAGIDFVNVNGWQPESPFIRTRRALLPPVAENEHVIYADQRLVLLLTNVASVSLRVDARLEDLPFLPESPTQLLYQVDDRPVQQLLLTDKEDWRSFTLTIPAGEHSVRMYQRQSVGNQYVKLRFDDSLSNLAVALERPYFISTRQNPLELYSQGPAELRVDELNEGNISYRYQSVPEGWHKITLLPPVGRSRSLLRVSQRVVNLQPQALNNRVIMRTLHPVPAPEAVLTPPVSADKVELIDAFKLGEQEDGTLSVGLDFVRRNNKQESGSTLAEEQFAQYRMNYRYFDEPRDAYWNTQGFSRIREHGGPTFGLQESVYYNPDWLPFTVRSEAKVFAQVPHDRLEALGQWDITLAQAFNLHPKTRLIPNLTFFARAMSLRTSSLARTDNNFKLKVDQDVFTPYKADHTMGLIPALTAEHRPWLDTLWSTRFSVGSNEDSNFTNPDHLRTETHWQQLLGSVALDVSYLMTFYQRDADRAIPTNRSYAGVELNWQHWTDHQNRFEVAAQYSYDIERRANLAMLSFTLHLGEGRGFRDFSPIEIDFRDIRQRQFVDGHNNVMRDVVNCNGQCPAAGTVE
jgi:hypothetical protein